MTWKFSNPGVSWGHGVAWIMDLPRGADLPHLVLGVLIVSFSSVSANTERMGFGFLEMFSWYPLTTDAYLSWLEKSSFWIYTVASASHEEMLSWVRSPLLQHLVALIKYKQSWGWVSWQFQHQEAEAERLLCVQGQPGLRSQVEGAQREGRKRERGRKEEPSKQK